MVKLWSSVMAIFKTKGELCGHALVPERGGMSSSRPPIVFAKNLIKEYAFASEQF